MKTKLILLLILFLSKGIHLNSQEKSAPFNPIELKETGIISHLMVVKQTSEYKTKFYLTRWSEEIIKIDDVIKKIINSDTIKMLEKHKESYKNAIDSISIRYTRLQTAYDRIVLQLDYIIQSRNRSLFIKRLNRNIRKSNPQKSFTIKGTNTMKLFLSNLNTCLLQYELLLSTIDVKNAKLIPFNPNVYYDKNDPENSSFTTSNLNLPDLISTTEQIVGIANTIDEMNGRRVDDVSKLLQACRFKSVTELLTTKKEEEEKKCECEDNKE
ncbi:MAG: hypothetical protein IM638_10375 [Bacteroidetes bacterium]|nr:hypothetical protein [Bacteroidota bacterium]